MCPTHSEAKHTETLEFGAEKGLLQGHARRRLAHAPQNPELSEGFQQSIFKGQVREGDGRVCDRFMHNSLAASEVIGPCHRGSHHQSLGTSRSGGYMLMVIK